MSNPGAPLQPLPDEMDSSMRREMNRGLMVRFINADLFSRAGLDVRRSYVLYDEAGIFEWALEQLPDSDVCQRLHDQAGVRYWSKGIGA